MPEANQGNAFTHVLASAIHGPGRGCNPVLREMRIGGVRRRRELVQGTSARIGAPHAVWRQNDQLAAVLHGRSAPRVG